MKITSSISIALVCLGVVLLMPAISSASMINIDFDTFPDGTPVPVGSSITNQYSSQGVTFSSTSGGPVIWSQGEASSPPNFLVGSPNSFYPIFVDLADPLITSFSAMLISVGDSRVTATAYASDLTTILDSIMVTNPGTDNGLNNKDPITLYGEGIAKVTFAITLPHPSDGFGIDDLVIENSASATPEPGTLVLLVSALGAGCWCHRRRKTGATSA